MLVLGNLEPLVGCEFLAFVVYAECIKLLIFLVLCSIFAGIVVIDSVLLLFLRSNLMIGIMYLLIDVPFMAEVKPDV